MNRFQKNLIALLILLSAIGPNAIGKVPSSSGTSVRMAIFKASGPRASQGTCVADLRETPDTILKRSGVRTTGAGQQELKALARGLQHIQTLSGPKGFSAISDAHFRFRDSSVKGSGLALGSFDGTYINIKRSGSRPDDNVGHLMHELGHHVGNRQGNYAAYRKSVPRPCQFSNYCRHVTSVGAPRNEEFAEVFAAFLLHPEILKENGPNCSQAFQFFAGLFPNSDRFARCGAEPDLILTKLPVSRPEPRPLPKPQPKPIEVERPVESPRTISEIPEVKPVVTPQGPIRLPCLKEPGVQDLHALSTELKTEYPASAQEDGSRAATDDDDLRPGLRVRLPSLLQTN